jgi:hypothetical protein
VRLFKAGLALSLRKGGRPKTQVRCLRRGIRSTGTTRRSCLGYWCWDSVRPIEDRGRKLREARPEIEAETRGGGGGNLFPAARIRNSLRSCCKLSWTSRTCSHKVLNHDFRDPALKTISITASRSMVGRQRCESVNLFERETVRRT